MARDSGLEELLTEDLAGVPGLSTRAMFGGLVWLLDGKLLCGARHDGMLVRLGAGRDGWALALPGVAPMMSRGRPMAGWIWAGDAAYGDDTVRHRLRDAALLFVRAQPGKVAPVPEHPWDFPDHPDPSSHPARSRRQKA